MQANVSEKCEHHIELNVTQYAMQIGSLRVDLDSKMDYIFEAFIGLLTDTLLDVFNNQMADVLKDLFVQVGNDGLADSAALSFIYNEQDTVCTDQRYVSIQVYDKYFKVGYVGQIGFLKFEPDEEMESCTGTDEVIVDSEPAQMTNDGV